MIKANKMKMLNKDVLVKLKPKTEVANSVIYVKEDPTENGGLQFFTVLAKSDEVTMFDVGDTVICDWKRITSPFKADVDGKVENVGITSEDEILGVLED